MNSRALWNASKHKYHRQRIVHIPESIVECRIPLQNNMVHIIQRSRVSHLVSLLPIPSAFSLFQLFQEDFVRSESFDERLKIPFSFGRILSSCLMEKKLDVFGVVVSPITGSTLSCLLSALWFSRVDTLQNTQSSEVCERKLHIKLEKTTRHKNTWSFFLAFLREIYAVASPAVYFFFMPCFLYTILFSKNAFI